MLVKSTRHLSLAKNQYFAIDKVNCVYSIMLGDKKIQNLAQKNEDSLFKIRKSSFFALQINLTKNHS